MATYHINLIISCSKSIENYIIFLPFFKTVYYKLGINFALPVALDHNFVNNTL